MIHLLRCPLLLLSIFTTANAATATNQLVVDLASITSAITHQGSGILYGFSADATLPPANYSKAVKLQYYRGGGGHSAPGYEQDQGAGFDKLWAAAEAMIERAHSEGAKAILVICDLWAKFDGGAGRGEIPGDKNDWTHYNAFIDNIISKVKAMGPAADSIQFELWNEPARGFFWRGHDEPAYSQYLEMWSRGFKRLRAAIPKAVIVGPSIWGGPDPEDTPGNASAGLFNQFLDETKANDTFPDILSWHVLYDSFATDYNPSPAYEVPRIQASLKARGLPTNVKLMINEYGGDKAQLSPTSAAWWLSTLERYNIAGCRSIECGCCEDPNLSCMLQQQSPGSFTTTAIFDVYHAYASMSGKLANVAIDVASQIAPFDAVASLDSSAAWILVGQAMNETGPYSSTAYNSTLTLKGLDKQLWGSGGKVNVTIGGSVGFPLVPSMTQTMVVGSDGVLDLTLEMGGGQANNWYFIEVSGAAASQDELVVV